MVSAGSAGKDTVRCGYCGYDNQKPRRIPPGTESWKRSCRQCGEWFWIVRPKPAYEQRYLVEARRALA